MRAFSIPESRADQIAWLESELVGTELHTLVAELQAVHGEQQTEPFELDEATVSAVRERGLAELSDEQFTKVLRHGTPLLNLQRDVLQHGGRYWSEVKSPEDLPNPIAFRGTESSQTLTQTQTTNKQVVAPKPKSSIGSNVVWATIASLATAATLLLFVRPPATNSNITKVPADTVEQVVTAKPAWGFAKFANAIETEEQQLEPPLNREAYLRELAAAAEAWANKKPDNSVALAQRIGEFRMGCSAILMATHGPLPEADRTWLRERCRSWANALDRHLAAVEAGDPVEQVRSDVDTTVTKIAAALLGRADTPTG